MERIHQTKHRGSEGIKQNTLKHERKKSLSDRKGETEQMMMKRPKNREKEIQKTRKVPRGDYPNRRTRNMKKHKRRTQEQRKRAIEGTDINIIV